MTENNQPDQGKTPDDDEPVLELTEEITAASDDAGEFIDHEEDDFVDSLGMEIGTEDEDDEDAADHEEDDFVDSLGMEIGTEDEDDEDAAEPEETAAEPADTVPAEEIDVSSEQLDAALERVIKNMFYDKIDSVLAEVIEKTVSKEIARLKKILTEEVSGDER